MPRMLTIAFTLLTVLGLPPGLFRAPVQAEVLAVKLSDGTTRFVGIPRLERTAASRNDARAWNVRYSFTIAVPENASEPLGQLWIRHAQGSDRNLRYEVEKTQAFIGQGNRGESIALGTVQFDRDQQTFTIPFELPVPPGTTVTVVLYPVITPPDGVHLFEVKAAPAGEKPVAQFLGYGRLHFYDQRSFGNWGWR